MNTPILTITSASLLPLMATCPFKTFLRNYVNREFYFSTLGIFALKNMAYIIVLVLKS